MRQTWVGKVENLIITKENSAGDWVVVRLSNRDERAPEWYALELSHRTPTSMAIYNQLRDARVSESRIRLIVDRADDNTSGPDWQRAVILGVEDPALPTDSKRRFN